MRPMMAGDDHNLLGHRTTGDPHGMYGRKDQHGAGGTLPSGNDNDTLRYESASSAWVASAELQVDEVGQLVSVAHDFFLNGSNECVGTWAIHGASGSEKISVRKVGPGALLFAVDSDVDRVQLLGQLLLKRRLVNSSPYAVVNQDCYLAVDTTGAIQINLPAASAGERLLIVADALGTGALVNNITVARNGADTINLVAANYVMNLTRESRMFYSNGSANWEVLGGLL